MFYCIPSLLVVAGRRPTGWRWACPSSCGRRRNCGAAWPTPSTRAWASLKRTGPSSRRLRTTTFLSPRGSRMMSSTAGRWPRPSRPGSTSSGRTGASSWAGRGSWRASPVKGRWRRRTSAWRATTTRRRTRHPWRRRTSVSWRRTPRRSRRTSALTGCTGTTQLLRRSGAPCNHKNRSQTCQGSARTSRGRPRPSRPRGSTSKVTSEARPGSSRC
mmetsp:Transcript_25207/g.70778  ORF Transcript_25207/g.70778 Transcript_25207/m.70778 type:complete len:215 (+) Transcript_25207:2191-2835(+)